MGREVIEGTLVQYKDNYGYRVWVRLLSTTYQ